MAIRPCAACLSADVRGAAVGGEVARDGNLGPHATSPIIDARLACKMTTSGQFAAAVARGDSR